MSTPKKPVRPGAVAPKRPPVKGAPAQPKAPRKATKPARQAPKQPRQAPKPPQAAPAAPGSPWARVGARIDPGDLPAPASPRPGAGTASAGSTSTGTTATATRGKAVSTETLPPPKPARAAEPPERRAESAAPSALHLAVARTKARFTAPAPSARLAEKRSADRRRFVIVWGRRAGYVAAVVLAAWLVLLSPVFALDAAKVSVSGYGTVVDPMEVRGVVDDMAGRSLALVSVGHLASQLQDIPGVREAHVERSWPNGLVVSLESREPVAAIPDPQGGFNLVDDEGVQVGRAAKVPKELPKLTVPLGEENAKVLASALGVINAMPAALRDRVQAMSAATEDSVSFVLRDGPRVEWGSADDSAVKVQVLQVLLESKQARKADVIDVSAPTLPITKNS